jgi:hypothetical protein
VGFFTIDALRVAPAAATVAPVPVPDPVAVSVAGSYTGAEGSAVAMRATASGGTGPYTYAWDFRGDGTFGTSGQNVSFAFPDSGTYKVGLHVTDLLGRIALASTMVTVSNVAPTASTGGPYTATAGQAVTLQGSATDPSPVDTAAGFTYVWDFGDGTSKVSGLGLNAPSHVYAAGVYNLALTVQDKDGGSTTVTTTANVAGTGTSNGQILAQVGLTPGWATFGEVLPQGVARGGLQLGNLVTQTDVKNVWPDGSIRYAIVSASVPAVGTYPLEAAAAPTGTFTPTNPDASVRFTIGNNVFIATLPKAVSSDTWLSGPLVTERRYTLIPVAVDGTPQPYLSVIIDLRSYVDGETRLDVTVENTFDKASASQIAYAVDIMSGGQVLYHHDTLTQYYLTRWRKVFDLGLTESQVATDFTSFYQAGALPQYLSTVANTTLSATGPSFDILGLGGLSDPNMGAPGGRPEIAPYTDWTASYLVYGTAAQRAYVLANGDLAGSQPIHIRETDGSLVSIDLRPQFWLDSRDQGFPDAPRGDLSAASLGPFQFDTAHQPSLAYVPYLITGDRYYADELKFWANANLLLSQPYYERNNSQGLLAVSQVRAFAWGLRNLTDAAAYVPDADPTKAYFVSKLQNNLKWADDYADGNATNRTWTTPPSNLLGTSFEITSTNTAAPWNTRVFIIQWEENYLAWAIGHANDQGFSGGTVLENRIVAFQLKLFTSAPSYKPAYAGPYVLAVGLVDANGNRTMFTQLKQAFDTTYQNPTDGTYPPTTTPFAGYYGEDARLALMFAVTQGMTGAQDALDYLMSQPGMVDYINKAAGWAIRPRSK